MKLLMILAISFAQGPLVSAMNLENYLAQVQNKNKSIKAFELNLEVAEAKRLAGDMSLVPVLQLKSSYLKDEKLPNPYGATANQNTIYSLGLSKKFATGTQLSLASFTGHISNPGMSGALAGSMGDYYNGSLNFAISQSLWKDAFGKGTRLRQERESVVSEAEKMGARIQSRLLLIDAEKAFWDLIYQQDELKLRQANLERAERILKWVSKRVWDGIGDRADLLNARALVTTRRLQLESSADDLKAAEEKVRTVLQLNVGEQLPQLDGSIDTPRTSNLYLKSMPLASLPNGRTITLEAAAKHLESRIQKIAADETADGLKADLVLSGSYASNPYYPKGSMSDVTSHLSDFGKPTSNVALTWTYLFDTDVKSAQAAQARTAAQSGELKSEQSLLESDSQWLEYQRRYKTLSEKIKTFTEISNIQSERAKVEQDKYSKGRSITQYVISAEQDAAEAQLSVHKLEAEQRKMETQSHLFITVAN